MRPFTNKNQQFRSKKEALIYLLCKHRGKRVSSKEIVEFTWSFNHMDLIRRLRKENGLDIDHKFVWNKKTNCNHGFYKLN